MYTWNYAAGATADLRLTPLERLAQFPREPDLLCYALRCAAAVLIRLGLGLYHRLRIRGRENLPRDGSSFVIVANHASHLDALCILSALPLTKLHRAFPASAADYFFTSLPRTATAALVVNALPFHRNGTTAALRESMSQCGEVLATDGNILIVFPEGTRSATGTVGPFKRGVGDLVAGRDVHVIPCGIEGAARAWPKGAWLPRPFKLRVTFGRPCRYTHLDRSKQSALSICGDLRRRVVELMPGEANPAVPALPATEY